MNKTQNKHLQMFTTTQVSMDANTSLWSGIPIIVSVKNNFDELVQRIEVKSEETTPKSKILTKDKEKTLHNLAGKVMAIAGILQAYAAINNNSKLAAKVKLAKSDITKAREKDIEALVEPIIKEARKNLSNLVEYALSEEIILETETTLDDYKALSGQARTIRNQAFAAMDTLETLFDSANDLLKNKLDKLMIQFENQQAEFYSEYKRARTIID